MNVHPTFVKSLAGAYINASVPGHRCRAVVSDTAARSYFMLSPSPVCDLWGNCGKRPLPLGISMGG